MGWEERTVGVDFADCNFVFLPDEGVGELLVDGGEGLAVCELWRQLMYGFSSCDGRKHTTTPRLSFA